MDYQTVYKHLAAHYDINQLKTFERAYKFAESAHSGQVRKSGDPYTTHALAVADYLGNHLHMDMNTVVAGLLHDIDYEETNDKPEEHSLIGSAMLSKLGLPEEIVRAVKVHNERHGLPREFLLDKVLYAADPLSGLITAVAFVYPDRKLSSVKVSSVIKRFLKERQKEIGLTAKEINDKSIKSFIKI